MTIISHILHIHYKYHSRGTLNSRYTGMALREVDNIYKTVHLLIQVSAYSLVDHFRLKVPLSTFPPDGGLLIGDDLVEGVVPDGLLDAADPLTAVLLVSGGQPAMVMSILLPYYDPCITVPCDQPQPPPAG